jgi:hypothetical protein
MMEALGSSETSAFTRTTQCNLPDEGLLNFYPDDGGDSFLRNVGSNDPHGATPLKKAFLQKSPKGKRHVKDVGVHGKILLKRILR